jgi:hypothetical protein
MSQEEEDNPDIDMVEESIEFLIKTLNTKRYDGVYGYSMGA